MSRKGNMTDDVKKIGNLRSNGCNCIVKRPRMFYSMMAMKCSVFLFPPAKNYNEKYLKALSDDITDVKHSLTECFSILIVT